METVDLQDLLRFMRGKLKYFLFSLLFCCSAGAIYAFVIQKPEYSSYTTIVLGGSSATTITTTDININKSLIDTYTEVVKSSRVLNQVIAKLNLDISYESLCEKIKVKDVNDTEIIKITAKYSDAETAKNIANTTAYFFMQEIIALYNLENVNILDEAIVDYEPSNINYPLQALISIVAGVAIAIFIIFILYSFDSTIKSAEQVEQRVRLSVLGKIRELHGDFETDLVLSEKPKSVVSEDIRTIRTNIQLGLSGKGSKAILVTSSTPSEGKSFISSNLALAFAQTGKKTILIDCDLRRGRIHHSFKVSNEQGLSTILAAPINDNAITMYKKKENLYVIPRGPVPVNPSELLNGEKFKTLLTYLRKNFDYIVIDGTPTQGLPDALILASVSDYSVIVCSNNQTSLDVLQSTKKALQGVNSKIAGVIINHIKETDGGYYGGYYGKYGK